MKKINLLVDSCGDFTDEMRAELGIKKIPLSLMLGERSLTDDETLSVADFIKQMKECKEKIGSAAPAPALFEEAMEHDALNFCVTLSGNLSATHQNACIAATDAAKKGIEVAVVDSKSASGGLALVTFKILDYLKQGLQKNEIVAKVTEYVKRMKTYFVLNDNSNLVKNGRLSKIKGTILNVLNLKPIMGSDGDGNIALFGLTKGQNNAVEKLAKTVADSGIETRGERMIITHVNNPQFAEKLKGVIQERFHFDQIYIIPCGGLSSLYANDGGVIMCY